MTHAICVRCGEMKFGSFVPCKACGQTPVSSRQLAYSIIFSDHCFEHEKLTELSRQVLNERIPLPLVPLEDEQEYIAGFGLGRPLFCEGEPDVLSRRIDKTDESSKQN